MVDDLLNTNSALVNISLSKRDYFISAYPGKVAFGEVELFCFIPLKHFVIYRHDFCTFYEKILVILESLCEKKLKSAILIQNSDNIYGFEVKNETVTFLIEGNSEIVYKTLFSMCEFNNLIDAFRELILSALLLRQHEVTLVKKLSLLDLPKLKELENNEALIQFLNKSSSNKCENSILIQLNFDIVILLHKLNKLVSIDYRKSYYSILACKK